MSVNGYQSCVLPSRNRRQRKKMKNSSAGDFLIAKHSREWFALVPSQITSLETQKSDFN